MARFDPHPPEQEEAPDHYSCPDCQGRLPWQPDKTLSTADSNYWTCPHCGKQSSEREIVPIFSDDIGDDLRLLHIPQIAAKWEDWSSWELACPFWSPVGLHGAIADLVQQNGVNPSGWYWTSSQEGSMSVHAWLDGLGGELACYILGGEPRRLVLGGKDVMAAWVPRQQNSPEAKSCIDWAIAECNSALSSLPMFSGVWVADYNVATHAVRLTHHHQTGYILLVVVSEGGGAIAQIRRWQPAAPPGILVRVEGASLRVVLSRLEDEALMAGRRLMTFSREW